MIFSTAHHRSSAIRVLFATPQQKAFFEDGIINTHYTNLTFSLFDEYLAAEAKQEIVLIADVPINFEILTGIVEKGREVGSEVILILLKINKKYLNMIEKRVNIKGEVM